MSESEGGRELAYFAGVDVGGTKIAIGIGDESGKILREDRLITADIIDDGGRALDAIAKKIAELCQQSGIELKNLSSIGVGSPGPLNGGKLLKTANLPQWEGLDLEAGLMSRCGVPAFVENDATAAAMGEWLYGAGKGLTHMLFVTVSTGIGAGIVVNGQRDGGIQGNAGEFGHIVMKPDGFLCRCGKHGCLETLASGTAIARVAKEQAQNSPYLRNIKDVDAAAVFDGYAEQDAICQDVLEQASHYLGLGLSYLVNLFNPQMIILGGGVIANHHEWLKSITANTKKYSMDAMYQAVTIAPAQLGANSGLQGALAAGVMGQTR